MRAITVQAIDGRTWTVRRRWVPRLGAETLWGRSRRRMRKVLRRGDDLDVGSGCVDIGGLDDLLLVLALLVVLALAFFVVVPLLVALVDVLIVGLLAVLGIIGRIAFGRPWTIEAVGSDASRIRWHVVGWKASRAMITDLADRLRVGMPLPEPVVWEPGPAAGPR